MGDPRAVLSLWRIQIAEQRWCVQVHQPFVVVVAFADLREQFNLSLLLKMELILLLRVADIVGLVLAFDFGAWRSRLLAVL